MEQTTSKLREVVNARVPLCALPVEILHQIIDMIPDQLELSTEHFDFEPFWLSATRDNAMLFPLIGTCRYLRKLALSNPLLWSTVTTSSASSKISQAWSGDQNYLAVVATSTKDFTNILDTFYPIHAHRIRELHFTEMGHRHVNYVQSLMNSSSSSLSSYAFCGRTGDILKWPTRALPLSPTSTQSLQDLYIRDVPLLPSVSLPHLTHLALCGIRFDDLHAAVANLLSLCPSLEALVLSKLCQTDTAHIMDPPQPLPLSMSKLRRLTFHRLLEKSLRYFLALLPSTPSQSATQLLSNVPDMSSVFQWLSTNVFQNATKLAFTRARPTPSSKHLQYVALTITTPHHVAHVVRDTFDMLWVESAIHGVDAWFKGFFPLSTTLLAVREVEVTNIRMADVEFKVVQSIITSLPALENLVLKRDDLDGIMTPIFLADLSLCPSALGPSFQCHRLRTVRLAYGLSRRSSQSYTRYALSFKKVFAQLQSGAYDYLKHLVVQVAWQLVVSEADLSRLREHFLTVQVEYVDVLPDLPLPSYCDEPRAGLYKERAEWRGALW